ncbi:MAG: DUF92 domain-containing protein [Methanosarcinaceae archaeon]|nr:DUF92 domain-containing protein [Methanosarcinaceae archaeon]
MNHTPLYIGNMDHEYRRKLIHAGFGLSLLVFPFLDIKVLAVLSFLLLVTLKFLPENSWLYTLLAKKRTGVQSRTGTRGTAAAQNLAAASFILLLIGAILDFTSYSYPLYIIGGAIAISTFGDTAAGVVRYNDLAKFRSLTKQEYPGKTYVSEMHTSYSVPSSTAMLVTGIISAFLVGLWIVHWQGTVVSYNMLFFIAVIGAMIGALFETIPSVIDDNLSVPLASGMGMWVFSSLEYTVSPTQLASAFLFSLVLAYLAYRAKIADISALLSAALLGVLILVFTDISWFIILIAFFLLGGSFTKFKYAYKKTLGIAQSKGGVRSYEHVLCNSTAAVVLAVAHGIYPAYGEMILFAYLGTVATATGDTLASEIGSTARGRPLMITTLKPAEPGVDGAISPLGEFAAFAGALFIGLLAAAFGICDNTLLAITIPTIGGLIGTNIDSLLGATLQNNGVLSNSGVNFVSTFAGAVVTAGLYLLIV